MLHRCSFTCGVCVCGLTGKYSSSVGSTACTGCPAGQSSFLFSSVLASWSFDWKILLAHLAFVAHTDPPHFPWAHVQGSTPLQRVAPKAMTAQRVRKVGRHWRYCYVIMHGRFSSLPPLSLYSEQASTSLVLPARLVVRGSTTCR